MPPTKRVRRTDTPVCGGTVAWPRDGASWWTEHRENLVRTAAIDGCDVELHSSWCPRSHDARRRCTCTPITLPFSNPDIGEA